jgi:hypothetical protein
MPHQGVLTRPLRLSFRDFACSLKFVRNQGNSSPATLQSRNAGRNRTSPACREGAQRALKHKCDKLFLPSRTTRHVSGHDFSWAVRHRRTILPCAAGPRAAQRTPKTIYGPNEKLAVLDVSSRCLTPVVLDIIEQRCSRLRSLNSRFTNG